MSVFEIMRVEQHINYKCVMKQFEIFFWNVSNSIQLKKFVIQLLKVHASSRLIFLLICFGFLALGLYGMTNDKCRKVLLWTVRYDKSSLVRAAAPNALVLLEKPTEEIIDTLQSRFLIEKEPVVIQ